MTFEPHLTCLPAGRKVVDFVLKKYTEKMKAYIFCKKS
jgi:hypothetical protein